MGTAAHWRLAATEKAAEKAKQDGDEAAAPGPAMEKEETVAWQGTRFEGTGEVGTKVYLYHQEERALKHADGNVSAAVASLTKPGASMRPAEVRMAQHLVLQGEDSAYATLAIPELVEAIEEHGDAADAAKRLCTNPIVLNRSREEELKEMEEESKQLMGSPAMVRANEEEEADQHGGRPMLRLDGKR